MRTDGANSPWPEVRSELTPPPIGRRVGENAYLEGTFDAVLTPED